MLVCLDQRTGSGCGAHNPDGSRRCHQCGAVLRFALRLHNPGDQVGSYRLQHLIGHGGFGAVYAAEHVERTGWLVAVKETFAPESLRSFQSEFALLQTLDHPNLPYYYELFEHEGSGYLVMELVPGHSLEELVRRDPGPLLEPQVLAYAVQLCDVLAYLHQQTPPILHRDVKPANIRLTPDGLIKLVDFGLIKQGITATRSSRRAVTPAYAPIEQYGGGEHTSPQSDIYSLGATFYHLLAGQEPPSAPDRIAIAADPLVPLQQVNPQVAPHVAWAIQRAMQLRQSDRFADAVAMRRALLGEQPASPTVRIAPPDATPPPAAGPYAAPFRIVPGDITARLLGQLDADGQKIVAAAWSPDGRWLALGTSANLQIRLAETGQLLYKLDGGLMKNGLAWRPDGAMLAGATVDVARGGGSSVIVLWHSTGQIAQIIKAPQSLIIVGLRWSPDGTTLFCWSHRAIWQLRPADGQQNRTALSGSDLYAAELSPDGKFLVGVAGHIEVRLWEVADGNLRYKQRRSNTVARGEWDTLSAIVWSPDGLVFATGTADYMIRLWRAEDGTLLRTLEGASTPVSALAWSPDGRLIASARAKIGCYELWSAADGLLLSTTRLPVLANWLDQMGQEFVKPDTTIPGLFHNWRAHARGFWKALKNEFYDVRQVVWNPTEPVLAVVSDHTVHLWRAEEQ